MSYILIYYIFVPPVKHYIIDCCDMPLFFIFITFIDVFPVVPVYGRSGANIIFLVDRVEKAWNKRK